MEYLGRPPEGEKYLGAPKGDTQILPGDFLICYGPEEALLNLSKRVRGIKGDKEHEEAVKKAGLKRLEEEMLFGS